MKPWRGGTYSLLLLEGGGQEDNGSMHGANHHWRCVKSSSPWKVQSPEARVQRNQRPKSRVQRRESRETRVQRGESPVSTETRVQTSPVLLCNLSLLLLLVYHHKYLWFVPYATSENQAGMQPSPPSNKNPWRVSHGTVCVGASNSGATGGSVM